MKDRKIGKVKLGNKHPVVIVAEIGVDHMGDTNKARRQIDAAKACGADIVKFQIHLPDIEMVPNHPATNFHGGSLTEVFEKSHLTGEQHRGLKEYSEKIGIQYLCTPFCPTSVDVLNNVVKVDAFKTGSGEVTNLPHHRRLAQISAKTGKPVIVSTGMCTLEEIVETVAVYKEEKAINNLVLTHCVSEYPLNRYEDMNLGLIPLMRKAFGVPVGYSDHSQDNRPAFAAVALGARLIEKHFTLKYGDGGCDDSVALEPYMFKELVDGIRKVEAALGSEKVVRPEEQKVRSWAFHSIVVDIPLKKGDIITAKNVRPARPGVGIPAKFYDKRYSSALFGRKLTRNVPKNHVLQWSDLV